MARQTWNQLLATAETSGAALANSTTPTSLLPTAAVYTLPANFVDVGSSFRVKASGVFSTTGTPTLTLSLYLAGSTFCASQAITTASGATTTTWSVEFNLTVRAIGSGTTANAMFSGLAAGVTSATALTMIPATSPAVGSGFNSTQANAWDFYATWGTASASNTIQLVQYSLESLN